MKIKVPGEVQGMLNELNNAGYEAYVVGGCVRDALLGRKPHDWDITTSAEPLQVKKLFRRTIDTGLKHGTVTVMIKNTGYEITTYRTDGDYSDHRRPESVTFSRNLSDDLMRRDFTINAMAYHPEKGLVDLYGGVTDMEQKRIRAVGDPDARFDEDALRIMRAVRFAGQLGFTVEEETAAAIRKHAKDLSYVSKERIEAELTKLICSPHPEKIEEMYSPGITAEILPEFDRMMETPQNTPYHFTDVGHHTIAVMQNIEPTKILRYTALLHDVGKPQCKTTDENGVDHFKLHPIVGAKMAEPILRRLKMDNFTIESVCRLIYWHDFGINDDLTLSGMRRGLSRMGAEHFEDYMKIRNADMEGQSDYRREEKEQTVERIREMYETVMAEGNALTVKDLAVKGKDLMDAGIPAGPGMGEVLSYLLEEVLEDPSQNERELLLQKAKIYYSEK